MKPNHPLFWKEWKWAKWWSVVLTIVFITLLISLSDKLSIIKNTIYAGSYETYNTIFASYFNRFLQLTILVILPMVIILTVILFQDIRKGKVGEFIQSLPYTKKEVYKVKWAVGALSITIPFVIFLILSVLMRTSNSSWINNYYENYSYGNQIVMYDSYKYIVLPIIQAYIFFMVLYSVMMLIQTLIGNNIMAAVVGAIGLVAPWFIIEAGSITLSNILDKRINPEEYSKFATIYRFMIFDTGDINVKLLNGDIISSTTVIFNNYWVKICYLIIITLIALLIGSKLYSLNNSSKNGQLAMFKISEVMIIVGVTICSSILLNNILRGLVRESDNIYEFITLLIGGTIGYIIISKINKALKGCNI